MNAFKLLKPNQKHSRKFKRGHKKNGINTFQTGLYNSTTCWSTEQKKKLENIKKKDEKEGGKLRGKEFLKCLFCGKKIKHKRIPHLELHRVELDALHLAEMMIQHDRNIFRQDNPFQAMLVEVLLVRMVVQESLLEHSLES